MGAMPAGKSERPRRDETTAEARRTDRVRKVGKVLEIYERPAQALGSTADADLERLAAASRAGERALGTWARRVESFRLFKRSFENGTLGRSRLFAGDDPEPRPSPSIPFLWEGIAFVLGFGLSLLLT